MTEVHRAVSTNETGELRIGFGILDGRLVKLEYYIYIYILIYDISMIR